MQKRKFKINISIFLMVGINLSVWFSWNPGEYLLLFQNVEILATPETDFTSICSETVLVQVAL